MQWAGKFLILWCGLCGWAFAADAFRVHPYVQNPTSEAMTIRWLSQSPSAGTVTVQVSGEPKVFSSTPALAKALEYNPFKPEPGDAKPAPYLHSVRVTGLQPNCVYEYSVKQDGQEAASRFRTAPGRDTPVRLVVYSDSETEPESSTTPPVAWPAPPQHNRPEGLVNYVVNQTTGYIENLNLMASREPHLILVVGDLVETGGEQRDWDEFWRHNAGEYGQIASSVPILPSLGNHENYAGPGGGYSADGADFSTAKFRTYFEVPNNQAQQPEHQGRYYRVDYGPLTLITVDSSDGLPHQTAADTNHNLSGSQAPDFNPGSEQYCWLEAQLADARQHSRFVFVQFHHTMYGSGPHSIPFGQPNFSGQSGIAMRVLQPLFFRYGVTAVFSGHDELLERSEVTGTEILPDGSQHPHTISFYDVGIGGDGLRGPSNGFDNPFRKFLAHDDVPEVWDGKRLVSGGKHYGHLEVNLAPNSAGKWEAIITPVYAFPLMNADGQVTGWERREYADKVIAAGR